MSEEKMNTFKILRMIGEAPKELLNFTETSVLTRMAVFGNREGKNINPGVKELLKQTKLSRRPLIRALGSLVEKEVLILCCKRKNGSWDKSCYDINIPLLQKISSNNYESNRNKSYKDKLNSIKNTDSEPQVSAESGVGETLLSGVGETPLKEDIIEQVVSERHQGGVGETLLSGVGETPTPYTQFIEPIENLSIVKSEADSTFLVSEKKIKKVIEREKFLLVCAHNIFDYWKEVMNHPGAKLDEQRKRKIIRALEHGFTVEELKKAIDGAKKSPFHRGDNDTGTIYDSIGLIFRNPDKIGEFIGRFDSKGAVKNNNVTTGLKTSFTEKNKSQVNMLRRMSEKYFPELSNKSQLKIMEQNLLTSRQEHESNERK